MKNKTKRISAFLATALMTVTAITGATTVGAKEVNVTSPASYAITASTGKTANNLQYRISSKGNVTITGYTGDSSSVKVPSKIKGKPVKTIGDRAFSGNTNLKSVALPKTLTTIKESAFEDCANLKKVNLPDSLKSIGDTAFYESGLEKVTIPKNITKVSPRSFNKKLKAFTVNKKSKYFSAKNGVLYNKKKTAVVAYPQGKKDKSFTLPSTVKSVKDYAFQSSSLKTVKLDKNLTTIGRDSFSYTKLKEISFTKNVTTIKEYAFEMCFSLAKVTIPDNVKYIGTSAFENCSNLKTLKISCNKTLEFGIGVFSECSSLKTGVIPAKSAGYTYMGCSNMTSVKFVKGVKAIGKYELYNCISLKTVTVPKTVKSIGKKAIAYSCGYNGEDEEVNTSFVIKGTKGSIAEKYATKTGLIFKAV